MRRFTLFISAGFVVLGLGALFVRAQDEKKPAAAATAQGGQEQMMAAMAKAAAVGPEHEKLKAMAGKFDVAVEAYEAPGGPPEKSTGKSTNELIFGGRYLKIDYNGSMMGMPFHGFGLFGYDNVKKKYVTLWADEMSTQMQISEGSADASGNVITTMCSFDSPMDNSKHNMKQVWTIKDNDHHTYEAWDIPADGKENKLLSITYTRAKD